MAYSFFDAYGSVLSAESSVTGASQHRPNIAISSVMSIVPVQLTGASNASVSGTTGASIIGTAPVTQSGPWISSVISSTPSSMLVGASIFGAVPVTQITSPWIVAASVSGQAGASIIGTVPVTGNVGQAGTKISSVVGAYAEDTLSAGGDIGVLTLGLRNDTVASTVGTDLDYAIPAHDSAGRYLTKFFAPEESRVEGYASVVSTSVTTLVAAAGAGLRNYITDFWIANSGSSNSLITFKDGAGSILGYTVAPANGGSNSPGIATPIRTGANATFDFQPGTASSVIYATVKGFRAP